VQYRYKRHSRYDIQIIMEHCSVGSVNDLMCITKKTLNEEQIAAVCRPVVQGLEFMEQNNKIHRDIKPHNILLNSKGEAKLADFGISRDMSDSGTKRKTVIGTPFYLAPEVIKETGYDTKADIWALGISAIEMAEKDPPYHDLHSMRVLFLIANNPPPTLTHKEHWSEEFNDFIAQCLQKEPNERPNATALLSHPFLKKGSEESLLALIEGGERIIREHGGFELTMKAIARANADDSDDDTISLDGLNEGMGEFSDPASSGDSFGLFDLPIASAKFNDDDDDDNSDYEVPVSPRVVAPKESPVPASPTPNIVLTPSTPLRKAQAAIMLTPTNRRSAELRVSDQGSKRRNSIDWSGLMEPGSQGTPDNKRKARRASVTIRTNESVRPALNRVDSQNKSSREINSLLAELDAIDKPNSPSNSRDNLLAGTSSDSVTRRRSFTTASAASTSFVRNNPSYQVHQQLGVWRGKVAAKNPFRNNPQWVVTVNRPCQMCIVVKSDKPQLNIGFYVLQLRDIQHRLAVLPSYGLHSEFPPVRAPEISSQLQFQDANMKYVIVPYAEQLPLGEEVNYDLFMLTPSPDVKLAIKPVPDMEEVAIQGEWRGDTAGGCINFSSWRNNPQYYLHIKRAVDLYIFLTQNDSLLTHIGLYCIKVAAPPKKKVLFFERESLVTRDSKFHKKTEITPGKLFLDPGHYILMPTTYAPGQSARFTLSVLAAYKAEGNNNATRSFVLNKVKPWEHASVTGAWSSDTAGGCMNNTSWISNPKFHLNLVTKNELTIVLHRDESAANTKSASGVQSERPFMGFYLFKAEVGEAGTLSRDKLMHKTKNFLDLKEVAMSGLTLERGSYLIVPCTYNPGYQGSFGVTVYTDLDIITLNPVREQATLIKGAWSHVQCTAGGCINFPTWRSNAQYYLELEEVDEDDVTIDLVLEQEPHNNNVTVMSPQSGGNTAGKPQLPHIGFLVVKAPLGLQDKLMQLTSKDVIASAEYLNDYRVSKRMSINTGEWRSFVIIPTTFYPKEENSFTLRVIGPHITKLNRVPSTWVERAHDAAWSKSNNTCGGCMNNPTWMQNPKLIVFSQRATRYFLCLSQRLKPAQDPKTDLLAVGFYVFRKAEDAKLTFTKPNLVGKSEFSMSKDGKWHSHPFLRAE
jgi:serine/threonine protein kinase